MNLNKSLQKLQYPILLSNFNIKVQNRYIENLNKKKKREWFIQDFHFTFENNNYYIPDLILKFDHIDEDNPEFFLQPKQIIKIKNGQLKLDNTNKKYFLIIDKFQQESEE